MKVDPYDLKPEIWSSIEDDGTHLHLLVCGGSFTRGKESGEAPPIPGRVGATACDWLMHPVAIIPASPALVIYGFDASGRQWTRRKVDFMGLTLRPARAALAEAWRDMKSIGSSHNFKRANYKATTRFRLDLESCRAPQEKTMLRNINALLHWSQWEKRGLTDAQKATELASLGFPATAKQVEKIAEKHGL